MMNAVRILSQAAPGTSAAISGGGEGGQQRGKAKRRAPLLTVTGYFTEITEGQQGKFWGDPIEHPTYGTQLAATRLLICFSVTITMLDHLLLPACL